MLNSLRRFIKKGCVNLTDEHVKLSFFRRLLQKALFLGIEFQRNSLHDTSFIFRTFQKSETRGITVETKI